MGAQMSTEAISWVFRHSKSRLAARLVLLSIADHADADGRASWPSFRTISRDSGACFRQISRAIRKLVEIGELRINRCASPEGTNVYVLPHLHSFYSEATEMAQPRTGCDINLKIEKPEAALWKTEPRIGPHFTRREAAEIWNDLKSKFGASA